MQTDNYVRDISTLRIENAKEAGGKGANLGEQVAAELPVPPDFVLLRASYQDYCERVEWVRNSPPPTAGPWRKSAIVLN